MITSSYGTGIFFSVVNNEALGEKCNYYSTITITVGGQPSCHHPLQYARSFDVVSFDEEGPYTTPESDTGRYHVTL